MSYEFYSDVSKYPSDDIWESVKYACVSLKHLAVEDSGRDHIYLSCQNKLDTKWGSDIAIELRNEKELYLRFNLAPDEALILLIKQEMRKRAIEIEIEEL